MQSHIVLYRDEFSVPSNFSGSLLIVRFQTPGLNMPDCSAKEIRLKVAQYFPPPSFQAKVLEEFCREVEKRTDGRVKVDYYAGGSLLKAPAWKVCGHPVW